MSFRQRIVIDQKSVNLRIIDTFLSGVLFIKQIANIRAKFFTSLYLIVLLIPSMAFATDYYVSPSGSDTNQGYLNSPFKTIAKGISKLKAGDILHVRTGTYVERVFIPQSGTNISPITIIAYPGESPVIDGNGWLPNGDWAGLVQIEGNYINLSGFEVKNSNTNGTYLGGIGVALDGHHIKVSAMYVHDTWANGITAAGNSSIVEDCVIWNTCMANCPPNSIPIWSGALIGTHNTGTIFRRNIIHDAWGEAVTVGNTDYAIVEDNIIYNCYSVALYNCNAQYSLIQRNLIYQTKIMNNGSQVGIGLWDESSTHLSSNNIIINNLVYGCRRNLEANGMNNNVISNNTFVNSTYLACVQIYDETMINSSFINNIVVQDDALPVVWGLAANAELTRGYNLWSKVPVSSAYSTGDVIGNPQLAKTGSILAGELTADYFKLLSTSQAINKGEKISNVTEDFFRNSRDNIPDIGAIEYIVAVTGVTVKVLGDIDSITNDKGTLQLSNTVSPSDATNKTVIWSISNVTGQATINAIGLVSAVNNGTVTARATATDGSGVYGTLVITISNQTIPVTGVLITESGGASKITTNNETLQLSALVSPSNATYKTVAWSITNGSGQATINSTGLVSAISNGTVTTRATATDGSGVYDTLVITISNQNIPGNQTSYEDQPVKIYPNPAHELINIKIDDAALKPDYIRIINFLGKVVFQDKVLQNIKEFQILINLLNGFYIVQMVSGDLILFSQKLIVNN